MEEWSDHLAWAVPSAVALAVALLGFFQERLRRWLFGARLRAIFKLEAPFAVGEDKVDLTIQRRLRVRVGVVNDGLSPAHRVIVLASQVEKKTTEGWNSVDWLPVNLSWCHESGRELPFLPPQTTAFFELGLARVVDESTAGWVRAGVLELPGEKRFVFKTHGVEAWDAGYILEEGEYRITLHVAAADATPVRVVFSLRLVAGWGNEVERLQVGGEPGLLLDSQHPQSVLGAMRAWLLKLPPAG